MIRVEGLGVPLELVGLDRRIDRQLGLGDGRAAGQRDGRERQRRAADRAPQKIDKRIVWLSPPPLCILMTPARAVATVLPTQDAAGLSPRVSSTPNRRPS
jgi:hypothetical protein